MVVFTTFSAAAVPEVIVFALPVMLRAVAPPVALKPAPLVVVIARPPLGKLIVVPALLTRFTAMFAPVLSALLAPLNVTVPPVQFWTRMPELTPLAVIFPLSVTAPPVRP